MEEQSEKEICAKLIALYNETENKVKTEAKVKRAYIGKISEDAIREKVDNQLNSIMAEIHSINPRYKEGSKNFEQTRALVSETLASYEKALIDLSEFYDGKIEQLILRKVELEASLLGSILNEEYLYNVVLETENIKKNDKVRNTVKDNFSFIFNKLMRKKEEKKVVDPHLLSKLEDSNDVNEELKESMSQELEQVSNKKVENKAFITKLEGEIVRVNDEIDRMNDRKKKNIVDAMEVGDKSLTTSIKKPRIFGRITRFFVSRFNTSKVIESSIIDPLKLRIESFKNNELSNIQG